MLHVKMFQLLQVTKHKVCSFYIFFLNIGPNHLVIWDISLSKVHFAALIKCVKCVSPHVLS